MTLRIFFLGLLAAAAFNNARAADPDIAAIAAKEPGAVVSPSGLVFQEGKSAGQTGPDRGVVLLNINEKDHRDSCGPSQAHGGGDIDVFFLPAFGGNAFGRTVPYIQLQGPAQAATVGLIALEIPHNGLILAGERFV